MLEFLVISHLPRLSCQSRLSDDNGDEEVKTGVLHRSPGIYLTSEQNPGKPYLGVCAISHCLKWGPLPLNKLGRIVQHVVEKEGILNKTSVYNACD